MMMLSLSLGFTIALRFDYALYYGMYVMMKNMVTNTNNSIGIKAGKNAETPQQNEHY